jgi:hypothetical protein
MRNIENHKAEIGRICIGEKDRVEKPISDERSSYERSMDNRYEKLKILEEGAMFEI